MATDLLNELGGTYDSAIAESTLRASKWQDPSSSNAKSTNELQPFATSDDNRSYNSNGHPPTAASIDDIDDAFLRMRDELRSEISNIVDNADSAKQLMNRYKLATRDEHQGVMAEMNTLVQRNSALTTQIRWRCDSEKRALSRSCDDMQSLKVREFNNLVRSFKTACNVFSEALSKYDAVVRGNGYSSKSRA